MSTPSGLGDARKVAGLAGRLAEEFDAAFARRRPEPEPPGERLLLVLAGGDRYLLPVGEVERVVGDRGRVPVPSGPAGLVGVTGMQGDVVPVWSLAALLGSSPGEEAATVRLSGDRCLALAVDRLLDQESVRDDRVIAISGELPFAGRAVTLEGAAVPILDVGRLRAEIRRRCGVGAEEESG